MIKTRTWSHLLPHKEYIKVYYTDNYTVLEKRFNSTEYAVPFIKSLKKNPDFHFLEFRLVTEKSYKM
jgi:hypothetical protein